MPDTAVPVPFPLSSTPGMRPQETGGRLINCFADKAPEGASSDVLYRRTPGLQPNIVTPDNFHTRGFLDCGSILLWILDQRVYAVTASGGILSFVNIGVLSGTAPVTVARNNNAVPQNLATTELGCFNLFTASPPTAFADPDLPANPTSVSDMDGFFFFTFGDGRIFASDLNSVAVASNSFTTEQGLSIRRGVRFAGRFFAFGDKWTGVYRNQGLVPFPLQREVTIPRGLIGTHALAGWEVGWANELVWVGDDSIVYQLSGYTPVPISTDAVSRDIFDAGLAGLGPTLEAFIYMYNRQAIWSLTLPGSWTWEFNLTTGRWHERKSYQRNDWRARRSIRMFNKWLTGDAVTGDLYEITGNYFRDGLSALIYEIETGVASGFPKGMVIGRASFNITTGVGVVSIDSDPTVEISWSLDGGASYGNPIYRNLGNEGETKSHPYVLNCGLSRGQGVRFKLRVSDPIHVGCAGGAIEVEDRGASG